MLLKNVAGQGVYLFAYTTATGLPKAGDAANITGTLSKDGATPGVATATARPTEIAGLSGIYWQPFSQAESNCNAFGIAWSSTTTGVQIDPLTGFTGTTVLDATGLDNIPTTDAAGQATTWRQMVVKVYRRFFRGSDKNATTHQIRTFADDGTTVLTTQPYTDDGAGNETLGAAS